MDRSPEDKKLWEDQLHLEETEDLWKVFMVDWRGLLFSARARGKAKVTYHVGKWTKTPSWLEKRGYLITAFRRLDDAQSFIACYGGGDDIIHRIEARGVSVPTIKMCDGFISIGQFHVVGDGNWPPGTVFCKQVRILSREGP